MIGRIDLSKVDQMDQEEHDRILRYQKLDQQVFETFNHSDNSYDFYKECMKEQYQSPLRDRIQELEVEILKRELHIATIEKENDLIWKTFIERLAEEKLSKRLKEIEK